MTRIVDLSGIDAVQNMSDLEYYAVCMLNLVRVDDNLNIADCEENRLIENHLASLGIDIESMMSGLDKFSSNDLRELADTIDEL